MTIVNNHYRITLNPNDTEINIPIEITFDMEGREQAVEQFETNAVQTLINGIEDFEIGRFAHASWDNNPDKTEINYIFNFFNPNLPTTFINNPPSIGNWLDDYQYATFTDSEIYYFSNSFKGSFFKLDFYDSKIQESQKLLFTVILPTQQGVKEPGTIGPALNPTNVMVKKPKYILDYTGADKEGFFFYWLRKRDFINVDTFYMTAKFFDARLGVFVKMMNEPQSGLSSKFLFEGSDYFYYKVKLDYTTKTYEIFDRFNVRQGEGTPINWYEYVNPPE